MEHFEVSHATLVVSCTETHIAQLPGKISKFCWRAPTVSLWQHTMQNFNPLAPAASEQFAWTDTWTFFYPRATMKFQFKNFWPRLVWVEFLLLGSGQPSLVWHLAYGKFPLKIPNFSIFCPSGQKNLIRKGQKVSGSKPGRHLIYCGSKVCSGRDRAHL